MTPSTMPRIAAFHHVIAVSVVDCTWAPSAPAVDGCSTINATIAARVAAATTRTR